MRCRCRSAIAIRTTTCMSFRSVTTIGVTPNGLTVAGATDEDRLILKAWRDALSVPFGYRHPDHDVYVFPICNDHRRPAERPHGRRCHGRGPAYPQSLARCAVGAVRLSPSGPRRVCLSDL